MFARLLEPPAGSCLLLGPRGTGKSTWIGQRFPGALVLDLLDYSTYTELLTHPERLEPIVAAASAATVVIDEVQRAPILLDEVHRLIEQRGTRFVLIGSSARKLRRGGVNLLAGRSRTMAMHPLTAVELARSFNLRRSVTLGHLPTVHVVDDPERYLAGYVGTYLREEVMAEALTRNLDAFSRFLNAASFSQASVLSTTAVARDSGVNRKTVEGYFDLLDDLLIAFRLPVFRRRAKRAAATRSTSSFTANEALSPSRSSDHPAITRAISPACVCSATTTQWLVSTFSTAVSASTRSAASASCRSITRYRTCPRFSIRTTTKLLARM